MKFYSSAVTVKHYLLLADFSHRTSNHMQLYIPYLQVKFLKYQNNKMQVSHTLSMYFRKFHNDR